MSWMAAAAILSLAAGERENRLSRKEMRRARRLTRDQLDFDLERWEHYRANYGPLEQRLVQDAMAGVLPDYEQITGQVHADVESQFQGRRDAERRRLAGLGLDPSSGAYASSDRSLDINQATASAMGQNMIRQQERERAEQETWNRRRRVYGMGASAGASAMEGIRRGRSQMSALRGRAAERHRVSANNLFAQAGQMGMYAYMQGMDNPANAEPAPGFDPEQRDWKPPRSSDFGQDTDPFRNSWDSMNPNPFGGGRSRSMWGNEWGAMPGPGGHYSGSYYTTGGWR